MAGVLIVGAALAAGWPEIAVFALQTLLEEKARDTELLHELGRVYHELGENGKEVEIYNRITEIDPLDAEASRLGRDASARSSIQTGRWTQAESYRELIKDTKAAVFLEQQSRLVLAGCDPASGLVSRMVEKISGVEIVSAGERAPAQFRR